MPRIQQHEECKYSFSTIAGKMTTMMMISFFAHWSLHRALCLSWRRKTVITVTLLLLLVVSFLLQMRTRRIIIILMTKLIRKDFLKVMMKDEDKDDPFSLWNKRSQMATNQQSSLSLGGKHSLIPKHQHHILSTNHSMPKLFSTEGKQHVNNLHHYTLNC